jgi:multicomponent Na+:H+ antiporter subunit E
VKRSFSLGLAAVLLGVWLLLWGEVSLANLASGVAVVALVMLLIPQTDDDLVRPTVRPVWALRFVGRSLWSLLRANLVVALEVVRQDTKINTGIVAVPMPGCSDGLLTLVANVLGLAPGTMPVQVTVEPPVIYVHILHLDDVETSRAEVTALAQLAVRAFGSEEALAAIR